MKKIISLVGSLLLLVSFVSATNYIGDTIDFGVQVGQQASGYCSDYPDCEQYTNQYDCVYIGECEWYNGCDLTCDLDLSDNEATYAYAGYALKDPQGNIVEQSIPEENCNTLYQPTFQYQVDQAGTWKFCAIRYGIHVNYNQECSANLLNCQIEDCQEVIVDECNSEDLQSSIDNDVSNFFSNWLGTW